MIKRKNKLALIYVTTKGKSEALKIARVVLAKRLAAGSNIIKNVESLYWWKGKVQASTEAILIFKTTRASIPRLIKAVKALHSYECPCIVEVPLGKGNPDFFRWIEENMK
jgi:periplasmic divalent cation tolerance protein